jgi:hypothetical protein
VDVLVNGRFHDLGNRPVVAEVDDLGSLRLEDPAHDVDGGVVPVKQGGSRDHPDRVRGDVEFVRHADKIL